MKKISSSFCMCFLPVVSDNGLMVGKRSKSSSSSDAKPVLSPAKNATDSGNCFGRKNKLGRRSLSRFVNAVFLETSLMKKMRNKKLGQKLHRIYNGQRFKSKFKFESKPKKISDPTSNDAPPCEGISRSTNGNSSKISSCLSKSSSNSSTLMTASGRSSLSSSRSSVTTTSGRSSSSSLSCNPRPTLSKTVGNNKMVEKGNGKSRHGSNIVFCSLLLASLLVLVIWGKICAIFCTSTVLVFVNRWTKLIKRGPPDKFTVDLRVPEIDSKLYRKKIIMEGLLERNHTRNI
ncbi:hypothetical protein V6N13_129252 [Hibiscus sabdariffa]|uniref:Uncharacterized protein n=1 Tax=Hibiscus sabdariffa TaxID=183260 RepID=A0ABR2SKN2_9ROSI